MDEVAHQGPCHATIEEAFFLEWNLGGIPVKVRDGTVSRSPCSAFTSVKRWEDLDAHLDSSKGARYVRGTELRLRDGLRATLPVYSGKFPTCINRTLRFYFKISDISQARTWVSGS
ncbi:hypothetical protein HAX54_024988 [Datura stramonium]|uniref:Uncharacterized protein n=1 Tax=Datura stramonium TaxID=4076 RepID=A0ABS8UYZ5_DATST|nr:hypothetical protein [Datura stramonium]